MAFGYGDWSLGHVMGFGYFEIKETVKNSGLFRVVTDVYNSL